MPIYEYECQGCGHLMEVIVGEPPARCTACGRPDPVRILSAHRVATAPAAPETLCCGRTTRPSECVPGSCCGEAGGHGGGR